MKKIMVALLFAGFSLFANADMRDAQQQNQMQRMENERLRDEQRAYEQKRMDDQRKREDADRESQKEFQREQDQRFDKIYKRP
ncbi:MAG: hypothetical protein ACAH12_07810 [Methylophilaceae bacterium]|uniref:hypothetical protein n=1 Tax=Methylovorus sp. MM2 TaxID=1848038 RepID=UPI0007DEAB9D|nr:hypothetical protein [Methylovorus sp. MM2]OAM52227.1 hypothetical protein A7981_01685 [Methylovorus sp. MM2]